MITKHSLFLLLIFSLLLLSGCTVDANRIYVICKYDNEETYCYDNENNFYKVLEDSLVKVSGAGLRNIPALRLTPKTSDFIFKKQLPGLYKGTLTSVNGYIQKLLDDGGEYTVISSDSNIIESIVTLKDCSIRLIYNIKGDVRIYAVDNSGNSILPPYITEE